MIALLTALLLTADAGSPRNETEALASLLEKLQKESCAADAGAPVMCARVKAFLAGRPASPAPIFTLGFIEETGVKEPQLQLLDLSTAGATIAMVTPDDAAERAEFKAIIQALEKGDRTNALLNMVGHDAKRLPHLKTSVREGSLYFQVPGPLGGNWLRRSGSKLYLLSFKANLERPALRLTEFPDDRSAP